MEDFVIVNSFCEVDKTNMEMKSPDQIENGQKEPALSRNVSVKSQAGLRLGQIFVAEVVATTLLMFLVCLGCLDGGSGTPLSPLQSPLTSGFTVATLVACFGHISDAHMNPAVTACFLSLGRIDLPQFVVYVLAELLGAVTGVGLLRFLVPDSLLAQNPGQCETRVHPEMSYLAGSLFEFLITSLLIYLVCALVDVRSRAKQDSAPIKFGLAVAALSFAGGALTGASLNPVRSFAPALWNNSWSGQWVYWAGPMIAGFTVPKVYQLLFEKDLTTKTDSS